MIMSESKIQRMFGFVDNFSLAQKGQVLFLAPAIAQVLLLAGLIVIQVETADYYPRRTVQDREINDATTNLMLYNDLTLHGLSESIKTQKPPSKICTDNYLRMLLEEKNLQTYWNEFAERRKAIEVPTDRNAKVDAQRAQVKKDFTALYHSIAGSSTAAYEQAQSLKDIPPATPSSPSVPSDKKVTDAGSTAAMEKRKEALKAARAAQQGFIMMNQGEPFGPEHGARERSLWFTLLISYSAVSMACLLGAAFLFIRDLMKRLEILTENGQRYIARLDLHPRLVGEDEIAMLDAAFHDMSEAVQNSTQGHRLMMEKASDLICSLGKGGRIESVSNASSAVLGYMPDELMGSRLVDFIALDQQQKFSERLKWVIDNRSTATFEMQALRKDKKLIDLLWSVAWSSFDNSLFCITHDISETKRAERVQQELVQMVSHDLRSPLVAISGFHEFAERGILGNLDERGMYQIVNAKRSTQQMLTLVNDLLEAERLDSGMLQINKELIPFAEVVKTSRQGVIAQADARKIQIIVSDALPVVLGDKHRLTQIMANLLTNAIKFSKDGGRITVTATAAPDSVKVAVADDGYGFPEQFKRTIFERYHQSGDDDGNKKAGSGLGLSICKSLINLHGGEIWVDTGVGEGSTFYFTLPNEQPTASQAGGARAMRDSNPPQNGGRK